MHPISGSLMTWSRLRSSLFAVVGIGAITPISEAPILLAGEWGLSKEREEQGTHLQPRTESAPSTPFSDFPHGWLAIRMLSLIYLMGQTGL